MTLPDQGTPVGHHDVANTNHTPGNPPALPRAASYGSDGIPSYVYGGYSFSAPAASPMSAQPVLSPMAGDAMQPSAAWMATPQDTQTAQLGQLGNPNMQHHPHPHPHPHQLQAASRAAGPAPTNWFTFAQSQPHASSHLPAHPSTPSIATGPSYTMPSGFGSHAPSIAGTPRTAGHAFAQGPVFPAGTPSMPLQNGSGALPHCYGFLPPEQPEQTEQQMMSMAAALNAQQHQQMRSMMPQQAISSLTGNDQLPAAASSWPTAQGQAFYYAPFGYGPARDPAMDYGYLQAMPNVPNGPYPGTVPQPMYLSTMMVSNSITSFAHPQMMQQQQLQLQQQQQQQQQQQLPSPYPGPSTSLLHSLEDDTRNETRRKFVRTNSGTGGGGSALSNRRSSVDVHGHNHAAPMPETVPGSVTSQQQADNFFKMEPQDEPRNTTASALAERQTTSAASTADESDAGEDNDPMCISPAHKRSLSVAGSDEWNDAGKAGEVRVHTSLAAVPENSRLASDTTDAPAPPAPTDVANKEKRPEPPKKAKDNAPAALAAPPPAPTPQASTGRQERQERQEAVFVHMDAAEILQSSHSIFSDEHDSGSSPVKPVKFRPAGNAPIKVRKWSTVVHPPPPESGYGSMPREVDFDHSASNVFLQHQAQPVAPSSVTSKFKPMTSSFSAKSSAKQDGTGSASSPSPSQVRTLNWRPSDDRISIASTGLPPKTTAKAARLEEKKKATPNDETKAVKNTDAGQPGAESEEPLSVSKALAALSGKRGKAAQTARVARTKQVRKRTDGIASKPKPAMDLKAAGTPAGSTANPKEAALLAETKTGPSATE